MSVMDYVNKLIAYSSSYTTPYTVDSTAVYTDISGYTTPWSLLHNLSTDMSNPYREQVKLSDFDSDVIALDVNDVYDIGNDFSIFRKFTSIVGLHNSITSTLQGFSSQINDLPFPNLTTINSPQWNGTNWDAINTNLLVLVDSIGSESGINSMISDLTSNPTNSSLYNNDKTYKQNVLALLNSAIEIGTSNIGFTHPSGMRSALRLDAQQKYEFDLFQTSRDLIYVLYSIAKTLRSSSASKIHKTHEIDMQHNIKQGNLLWDVYKANMNSLIEQQKLEVTKTLEQVNYILDSNLVQYETLLNEYVAKSSIGIKKFVATANTSIEEIRTQNKIQRESAEYRYSELSRLEALRCGVNKINTETRSSFDKFSLGNFGEFITQSLAGIEIETRRKLASTTAQINGAAGALQAASIFNAGESEAEIRIAQITAG